MWDMSNTTTWVNGSHTLNFGVNYRRWWLQRDLATGLPRQLHLQRRLHRRPRGRHAARVLLRRGHLPAGGVQRAGSGGQPPRVQLQVLRAVLPGRLESELLADREPGPAVGLPERAVRNATTAWPGATSITDQAVCSWRTSRSSTAGSWTAAYYQYAGRRSPENPDRFKVFAPRLGFAWRPFGERDGDSRRLRRVLRFRRGPRDRRVRRRLSVRQPRQLHPVDRAADGAADDRRAVPELCRARSRDSRSEHVPRRQPVAASRRTPTCSSGRSACSGRSSRTPRWS